MSHPTWIFFHLPLHSGICKEKKKQAKFSFKEKNYCAKGVHSSEQTYVYNT